MSIIFLKSKLTDTVADVGKRPLHSFPNGLEFSMSTQLPALGVGL